MRERESERARERMRKGRTNLDLLMQIHLSLVLLRLWNLGTVADVLRVVVLQARAEERETVERAWVEVAKVTVQMCVCERERWGVGE